MEILAEIINFIFNWVLAMMMVHLILQLLEMRREKQPLNDEELERSDAIRAAVDALSKSKPAYIEKIEDQYLLYDSLKNAFLCQSNSLEGLAESCYKFSKINLAIVKYDHDYMIFREGEIIREGEEMEIRI